MKNTCIIHYILVFYSKKEKVQKESQKERSMKDGTDSKCKFSFR